MPEDSHTSPTLSVFSLLRESSRVFVANFSLISLLVLTFSVPDHLYTNYLWYEVWEQDLEPSDSSMPLLGLLAIFLLSSIVIYPLQSAAVVYATAQLYRGRAVSYKEAILVGFRWWPYLMPAYFITIVLFSLGLVIFIIPGLLVLMYFALIDQEVVLAQRGPLQALHNSARLVKVNLWLVFGVLISILVPVMCLAGGFGYVMGQHPTLDTIWFDTLSNIPLDIFSSLSLIALTIFYLKQTNPIRASQKG